MAVAIAWLLYVGASWLLAWNPADAGAYYDAAARLRSGDELYAPVHPEAHEAYRYAPWFALAWVPLTFLPRDVALHGWSLSMLAASVAAIWPLLRLRTHASITLSALLGAFLVETAMFGNAHPAVIALLVWTAGSRWLPIAVGIAASIKLVPIVFVIVWAGRREWRKVAVATAAAGMLAAPMLLFDLQHYVTTPGTGLLSLYRLSPLLWATTAAAAGAAAVLLAARRSPWAWTAVGVFAFLGPPRVALSYLAFLLVAVTMSLGEMRYATRQQLA